MPMSAHGIEAGDRFRIGPAPTLVAKLRTRAPFSFVRLRNDDPTAGSTMPVPPEGAYAIQVLMRDLKDPTLALRGRPVEIHQAVTASMFLFDLEQAPVATFNSPFETVRFYKSKDTINELGDANGLRRVGGLIVPPFGTPDHTIYSLAASLVPSFARPTDASSLFIDHVSLAFFSHLTSRYGGGVAPEHHPRGGLAPWQIRRAKDMIEANLHGDLRLAELARECGLSTSYFARAFRLSFGLPRIAGCSSAA